MVWPIGMGTLTSVILKKIESVIAMACRPARLAMSQLLALLYSQNVAKMRLAEETAVRQASLAGPFVPGGRAVSVTGCLDQWCSIHNLGTLNVGVLGIVAVNIRG